MPVTDVLDMARVTEAYAVCACEAEIEGRYEVLCIPRENQRSDGQYAFPHYLSH